jgi:hypothetical protein
MKFIEDVVSGKLLLGNYARLAVERHLNDLKNKDWEYTYSEAHAKRSLWLYLCPPAYQRRICWSKV